MCGDSKDHILTLYRGGPELMIHKIVLDHQPNFHKDPCKDARARGETRALVMPYKDSDPSHQKLRKCVFRHF